MSEERISIIADDAAVEMMIELKRRLHAEDYIDVIRKSLAIAQIVAREAGDRGIATIRGKCAIPGVSLDLTR